MFKNNRSIKQQILFSSLGLLLLAFIINAVLTGYFINNKSQEVLIEKAREQVYEMSKQAEDILDREDDPINALQEFVDEKAGQDNVAYAVVIDTNATAVAHSDHEKLNVVYDDDYTIKGSTEGVSQYSRFYADVQEIWSYDIMEPIYKDGELYGVLDIGVPESGITSILNAVIQNQIIVVVISFFVIGGLMWFVAHRIISGIKSLESLINNTSSLDFRDNQNLEKLTRRKDELGKMAEGVYTMRESLKQMIEDILVMTDNLSESSEKLSNSSSNTVNITKEISNAIDEIAKATEEQANDTEKGAEQIESLSTDIEKSIADIANITQLTKNINRQSSQGVEIVENLTEWSNKSKISSESVSHIVSKVDDMANDISGIVNTINDIAEQTNLLALNASIESARAGEVGKGFAVVAGEIRMLSEQTSNATNGIKQKIDNIQKMSKNAVEEISNSLEIVEENSKATKNTEEIFEQIKNAVAQTTRAVEESLELSNKMNEKKDQILAAVQNISASAEETSAGTEEVSASTGEQIENVQVVSNEVENLNNISRSIKKEMDKFKL